MHPLAGKPAPKEILVHIPKLLSDYESQHPTHPSQMVSFGTSGHRGTSLNGSYTRDHVWAITQAICEFRKIQGTTGPLFLGFDTHALSKPSQDDAIDVLMGNQVDTFFTHEFTPTPAVSRAILKWNKSHPPQHKADGIVITPSHNPPEDGGFKYNPPHGGPAGTEETSWIEKRANELIRQGLKEVKKTSSKDHLKEFDFISCYIEDLHEIIDFSQMAKLNIGADPLGGSNLHYWEPLADKYKLQITVVNKKADPTFSFMSVDHDGKIRMDCSSPAAMASLIALKNKFDIAFGNDADSDRHGIVTPTGGLMNPNHFLAVAIQWLFTTRKWPATTQIGKTLVSSGLIDRVGGKLQRKVCEVPVGFKWFVPGLLDGSFGFGGEESAGASFLTKAGTVWTTDKDGILLDLLAAEITSISQRDPFEHYQSLIQELGEPFYSRKDAPASAPQRDKLKKLQPENIAATSLAGEKITAVLNKAPGNGAPIGGIKIVTKNGWFAARPSGTEDIYKIYSESFLGETHLKQIEAQAQEIVGQVMG